MDQCESIQTAAIIWQIWGVFGVFDWVVVMYEIDLIWVDHKKRGLSPIVILHCQPATEFPTQ
jgi:hypothetical protein